MPKKQSKKPQGEPECVMKYKFLDSINYPADLRKLQKEDLKCVASELRHKTIDAVSKTGGHLGAGLGVVELTIALHYVFNTPIDKIVWDVGHQTYPHKILTGRKDRIETLRQEGGLSGFARVAESEYDCFGAGHSSTSISAAIGMTVAAHLQNQDLNVVAVIGDGAMSAGMAYEALNNAGHLKHKMLVVLNDNDMSIAPPTGALRNYLVKLLSSKPYLDIKNLTYKVVNRFPDLIEKMTRRTEVMLKNFALGSNIFEDLGFCYLGPIDGHDVDLMVDLLQKIRDHNFSTPVLLHVITKKGYGYSPAENSEDKFHGVTKFDVDSGKQAPSSSSSGSISYTKIFANELVNCAKSDDKIVAITAAMPGGTGLDSFAQHFSDRFFDVGIAEQHAVTFAAGLAISGMKPFCAIYSTFLQRAYDQIIHDVAIQNLPVRFAIDRAGFVGADGATHTGAFDIAFLRIVPNFVLMAPSSAQGLKDAVATAANYNEGPFAFRYPRGDAASCLADASGKVLPIGIGKMLQEGGDICFVCCGTILLNVVAAAKMLKDEHNIEVGIFDAIFIKPIDESRIIEIVKNYKVIITVEEGCAGGFWGIVFEALTKHNLVGKKGCAKVLGAHIPDKFFEHATMESLHKQSALDARSLCNMALKELRWGSRKG